ncbi:hypothetical protein HUX88_31635 [Duganella sp. BJB1802]|jgi:hypothetical protein|uniref:hypothetical protein n=1 Tax=Duganella sp. BJB1802 TaxID=2744575 RepID=UPI001594C4FB|nr:hypothetical protein [Duganella sp. BJB1802]NVD75034.1 hypothetical protein [Duganella sp. BJB1802]
MDKNTKEIEVVRLLADSVHESAELASALYEQDRLYRREDLHQVLDAKRLESAQIIAELFLKAAQLRDAQHLRALLDALFDAWEARRKRRQLARPGAAALGISGAEFFRRQQRMTELVGFLAMEILAVAFILALSKRGGGDDGGGTAAYLVKTVPELRPPCPIQEDQGDVDQEQEYDQEGQR